MALEYSVSSTVLTTAAPGCILLHHGCNAILAKNIVAKSIDSQEAMANSGRSEGDFWVTTNQQTAAIYALAAGVPKAILSFNLPLERLNWYLDPSQPHPMVYQHGDDTFQFLPPSFPTLNQSILGVTITTISDSDILLH